MVIFAMHVICVYFWQIQQNHDMVAEKNKLMGGGGVGEIKLRPKEVEEEI